LRSRAKHCSQSPLEQPADRRAKHGTSRVAGDVGAAMSPGVSFREALMHDFLIRDASHSMDRESEASRFLPTQRFTACERFTGCEHRTPAKRVFEAAVATSVLPPLSGLGLSVGAVTADSHPRLPSAAPSGAKNAVNTAVERQGLCPPVCSGNRTNNFKQRQRGSRQDFLAGRFGLVSCQCWMAG
jgi:hypothetical protein